jgi:hypothetical protein
MRSGRTSVAPRAWVAWLVVLLALPGNAKQAAAGGDGAEPAQPKPARSGGLETDAIMIEDLINEAIGRSSEDRLGRVIYRMGQSAAQLDERFETGRPTQYVQSKIIDELDALIDAARRSQGQGGRSRSSGQQPRAQQPRSSSAQPQPANQGGQPNQASNRAATDEFATKGSPRRPAEGPDFRQGRREWANLPQTEREQVVQSIVESVNAKFEALIRKYFQALLADEGS